MLKINKAKIIWRQWTMPEEMLKDILQGEGILHQNLSWNLKKQ